MLAPELRKELRKLAPVILRAMTRDTEAFTAEQRAAAAELLHELAGGRDSRTPRSATARARR